MATAMQAAWGVAEALLNYPDLAGDRVGSRYLFSASELLDHAALSATLTHENERRWRVFHERVEQLTDS